LALREISASAYEDLRRCPYRFFALRQLGLQEAAEIDVELGKRDFGSWLHEVLHQFHEALATEGQADRVQRAALMDQAAEGAKRKLGLQDGEFLPFEAGWPQLREGYLQALGEFETEHRARYECGEQSREAGLGSVRLVGRIDRIDRVGTAADAGGIRRLVMDYKTEDAKKTKGRVKDPLEDTQLAFYAALLGEEGLQGCYVNVGERGKTEFIPQPGLDEARDALVQGIVHDMDRIAAGAPLAALGEGSACEYCAARGLCRKDFWPR
jgi:ATP-dependent helicase/nuclease subunit B